MGKKVKDGAKKKKKVTDESKRVTEDKPVKSIADLFETSLTDPALEALFKPNAAPLLPFKKSIPTVEKINADRLTNVEQIVSAANNEPAKDPPSSLSNSETSSKKRKRREREEEVKIDNLELQHISKIYSQVTERQNTVAERSPEQHPLDSDSVKDDDVDSNLLQHEVLNSRSTDAAKTVFVSNLPVKVLTSKSHLRSLRQLFSTQGPITSIRFRSIAFTEQLPRKVAYILKKLHPERDTLNAYIVYQNEKSVSPTVQTMNGYLWEGKHLRVDSVAHPTPHDHKRSVFVGNLPFDVQDEDLFTHFLRCGKIEFVRVVRDKKTNVGKGFGYVQFMDRDSIDKAVLLNDKPFTPSKRKLRVTYAKNERKMEIKGNSAAARERLQRKHLTKRDGKSMITEGKRATKEGSGRSGFKLRKIKGKMRLLETK